MTADNSMEGKLWYGGDLGPWDMRGSLLWIRGGGSVVCGPDMSGVDVCASRRYSCFLGQYQHVKTRV